MGLILPKADLNLVLYVVGHFLCWLSNTDRVSSVIDGPRWPRRYFIKSETWLKLRERFLVRFLRFRGPGLSNLMVWLDRDYARSSKTNTGLLHYTRTNFIKKHFVFGFIFVCVFVVLFVLW